jgi:hypothetical protein
MRLSAKLCLIAVIACAMSAPVGIARAKRIDAAAAENAARAHVKKKRRLRRAPDVRLKYSAGKRGARNIGGARSRAAGRRTPTAPAQDTPAYYVFNENESDGGGFVIISGNDVARPVLGYSDSGNFDDNNLSPEFEYWMGYLQDQIEYAEEENIPQSESVKAEWDRLSEDGDSGAGGVGGPNGLIRTKWGQRSPYYDHCPVYGGSRCLSGCVATAISQIMKFHEFPATGNGYSAAYTTTTYEISVPSVNLNMDYDWDYMSEQYPVSGPDAQRMNDAVAALMYRVGASASMNYGPSSSGAYDAGAMKAFKAFGYANVELKHRSLLVPILNITIQNYTDEQWEQMLRDEIDAGRPVYYTGSSDTGAHAFVMDGYDGSGNFHFNWGWNGSLDGYYVTNALHASAAYTANQSIIMNIYPVPTAVSGISLNKTSATVSVGSPEQLTASVAPSDASNRRVSWSSSDETVATVSSGGLVVAAARGSAVITATTAEGGMTAACSVTVPYPTYRISYNLNGGTGGTGPSSYTQESAAITLGAPTRAHSIFHGWHESADFSGSAVQTIPQGSAGDKFFHAKWFCEDGYYADGPSSCKYCPHIAAP